MIKSSALAFHETFQPELGYIASILQLASENFSGSKYEISDCTGIPTGKNKGKVLPHIKYASYMGLINYEVNNGVYFLGLTELGRTVYDEDAYLYEELSAWLCHYGMTKRKFGAPQWEYLVHDVNPGLGNQFSQEKLYSLASTWCDATRKEMPIKVFSVVKGCYTEGCFSQLNFLSWEDKSGMIEFQEHAAQQDLIFVYAYALLDSWERLYGEQKEISEFDLKEGIGFDRIFGLNKDECDYVIESLSYEGIISVNRQLYPMTLIRQASAESVIPKLYSRLL